MFAKPATPYPGLRPFVAADAEVFCGRSDHRIELLERLEVSGFLAVVGSSGSGKSSLVHAGLIPDIDERRLIRAIQRERLYLSMRPGNHPFRALALALIDWAEDRQLPDAERLAEMLRRGPEGLVNFFSGLGDAENPHSIFLVVDQFEELFRFASATQHKRQIPGGALNEAQAFVNLLLRTAEVNRKALDISVIITMRSDFLKDCEQFDGLPEAISRSQFMTPRLDRDQLGEAMERPLRLYNASIEPELTRLILNELAPEQDQLPVLQHLLARMWENASKRRKKGGSIVIGRGDYEAVGMLERALADHRISAFSGYGDDLGEDGEVDRFFRCLAEFDPDGRLIRRPRSVRDVVEESGVPLSRVEEIAEIARADGCHFLMPPSPLPKGEKDPDEDLRGGMARVRREPLRPETVLDLTHESLIRKWPKYREVMGVERAKRDAFLRVRQVMDGLKPERAPDPELEAEFEEKPPAEKSALAQIKSLARDALNKTFANIRPLIPAWVLRDANQQLLVKPRPTNAWAARYCPDDGDSEDAWQTTEAFLLEDRKRARRRTRFELGAVVVVALAILGTAISWRLQRNAAQGRAEAQAEAKEALEDKLKAERKQLKVEKESAQQLAEMRKTLDDSLQEASQQIQEQAAVRDAVLVVVRLALEQNPPPWALRTDWTANFVPVIERELRAAINRKPEETQVTQVRAMLKSIQPESYSKLMQDRIQQLIRLDGDGDGRVNLLDNLLGGDPNSILLARIADDQGIINYSEFIDVTTPIPSLELQLVGPLKHPDYGELVHGGNGINGFAFAAADSKIGPALVTFGEDNLPNLWRYDGPEKIWFAGRERGSSHEVTAAAFGPSWFITGSGGSSVYTFPLAKGDGDDFEIGKSNKFINDTGHTDAITALRVFNHGRAMSKTSRIEGTSVVSASKDGARLWKNMSPEGLPATSERLLEKAPITSAEFSRSGALILLSGGKAAWIFSAESGKQVFHAKSTEFGMQRSVFRPDFVYPEFVTAGGSNEVLWWRAGQEAASYEPVARWKGHDATIIEARFSPPTAEGTILATGDAEGGIRVWPIPAGFEPEYEPSAQVLRQPGGDGAAVLSLAWSPDSQFLVAGLSDGRLLAWRFQLGLELTEEDAIEFDQVADAHDGPICQVGFSPDGRFLVSASGFPQLLADFFPDSVAESLKSKSDGRVLLWELK